LVIIEHIKKNLKIREFRYEYDGKSKWRGRQPIGKDN